jgi:hypothetical protein
VNRPFGGNVKRAEVFFFAKNAMKCLVVVSALGHRLAFSDPTFAQFPARDNLLCDRWEERELSLAEKVQPAIIP